jgi:hypothetical protein
MNSEQAELKTVYRLLIRTLSGSMIVKFSGKSSWTLLMASIKIRFSLSGTSRLEILLSEYPDDFLKDNVDYLQTPNLR